MRSILKLFTPSASPSSVFAECHSKVSPAPYVKTCKSDVCGGDNETCTVFAVYATECAKAGVCVDWRSATDGHCSA